MYLTSDHRVCTALDSHHGQQSCPSADVQDVGLHAFLVG